MRTRFIQNDILEFLQDYKLHTTQEICNELNISRSTCMRHVNDLSMYYNIQTFVGGRNSGGIKLIEKKPIRIDYLSNNELQLIIEKLGSLQDPTVNLKRFIQSLSRQVNEECENG